MRDIKVPPRANDYTPPKAATAVKIIGQIGGELRPILHTPPTSLPSAPTGKNGKWHRPLRAPGSPLRRPRAAGGPVEWRLRNPGTGARTARAKSPPGRGG